MRNIPDDPLKTLSVLIVEDQLQTRGWIADMLRAMGIRSIFLAGDGVDALGILAENAGGVDVILCDWAMPRMTGLELLMEVRKNYPDMPFLMQTGYGTQGHVVAAREKGVSAFIVKPFSGAQLEIKLRQVAKHVKRGPVTRGI